MAKSLIFFIILTLTIVGASSTIGLTAADGDCSNDMKNLSVKCMHYVMNPPNPKIPPSKDCCGAIRNTNMPCVCGHITKEVEKMISMEKVVFVSNACGRPLTKGSKCGSKRPKSYLTVLILGFYNLIC
jgi:Probable lipid transfer